MAKSRRPLDGRLDPADLVADLFDQANDDGATENATRIRRRPSVSAREMNKYPEPPPAGKERIGDDDFADF